MQLWECEGEDWEHKRERGEAGTPLTQPGRKAGRQRRRRGGETVSWVVGGSPPLPLPMVVGWSRWGGMGRSGGTAAWPAKAVQ